MKRKLQIILVIALMMMSNIIANANSKFSPEAYKLFKTLQSESKEANKLLANDYDISIICKLNNDFDFEKAKAIGAKFSTVVAGIATVRVSFDKYIEFIQLPGIVYIETGNYASPTLDSAKIITHIQEVIEGKDLPKAYNGEGVVVGIIDAGFDYTHPAFVNPLDSTLIITRVWEQGTSGKHPEGFSYGRELVGSNQILQAKSDTRAGSHGTHVAGIAVGQNVETAEQSIGIAKKSELVIVSLTPPSQEQWKNTGASDIVDGVNYIFKYAESIGKPAVVNLSWGGQIGPHDGTSLFSQAIDGLTGKGKIFVLSAGNDGNTKLHIDKNLTQDAPLITNINNYYNSQQTKNGIWIDAWGEEDKPFEFNFEIVDRNSLKAKYQTEYHSTAIDTIINHLFVEGNDTCEISIFLNKSPFNNKPHAFVDAKCNNKFLFRISAKADEGKINMWNWYLVDYYGIESSFFRYRGIEDEGNTNSTISDFSSTKSAIAVGAFTSKTSYMNYRGMTIKSGGKSGGLASFSSHGPSVDNRVKPDIVAPGMCISSAVSSFDSEYSDNGQSRLLVTAVIEKNGNSYPYACLNGTSMSSPVVTGAVAILLSQNNNLTPQETIELLKNGATKDNETKEVPNELWGWGKLNLYNIFRPVNVSNLQNSFELKYTNPITTNEAVLEIILEKSSHIEIAICDIFGNEIMQIYSGYSQSGILHKTLLTQSISNGAYFLKTTINNKSTFNKLIISK